MKARTIWILVLLIALALMYHNHKPWPITIECIDDDGRNYFMVFEINKGEDREQVKSTIRCSR